MNGWVYIPIAWYFGWLAHYLFRLLLDWRFAAARPDSDPGEKQPRDSQV